MLLMLLLLFGIASGCGEQAVSSFDERGSAKTLASVKEPIESTDESLESVQSDLNADVEVQETLVPAGLEDAPGATMTTSNTELYPMNAENITLTYWTAMDTNNLTYLPNGDIKNHNAWQVALDKMGINVEVYAESMQSSAEKAAILIAAGDLYDIMAGFVRYYPGGGETALEDGFIYDLNDYAEYCSNYLELINSDPDTHAKAVSDSGAIPCFYHLVDKQVGPGNGSYIRQDWLDELGLDIPVTVQDWEDVLLAFQNAYNPKYPYLLDASGFNSGNAIVSAYGVAASNFAQMNVDYPWFKMDGQVQYGMTTDGLKEYLTLMNKWYEYGLIAPDFTSFAAFEVDPDFNAAAANDAGIWNGFETIDHRWDEMASDPNYKQTPIPDPVLTEGDTLHLKGITSMVDNAAYSVTTSCEYPEEAFAFCNFWYTYDGYLLCNYGVEGEGLEFTEEGAPHYTDLVLNPESGMTVSVAQFLYSVNFVNGLFDMNRAVAYDIGCRAIWGSNRDGAYDLPYNNLTLTSDETTEFNTIMSDINTYTAERVVRFITGELDINEWDDFVSQVENLNISRATEILQNAYDRYLSR